MEKIIYLMFKRNDGADVYQKGIKYINTKNSLVSYSLGGKFICVTTTMDCLESHGWLDDLDYECDPTYHQPADKLLRHL